MQPLTSQPYLLLLQHTAYSLSAQQQTLLPTSVYKLQCQFNLLHKSTTDSFVVVIVVYGRPAVSGTKLPVGDWQWQMPLTDCLQCASNQSSLRMTWAKYFNELLLSRFRVKWGFSTKGRAHTNTLYAKCPAFEDTDGFSLGRRVLPRLGIAPFLPPNWSNRLSTDSDSESLSLSLLPVLYSRCK